MNRRKLLETLRALGYSEAEPTLESVEKYVKTNAVEVVYRGKPVDLKAAWGETSKVEALEDADGEDDQSASNKMSDGEVAEYRRLKSAEAKAARGTKPPPLADGMGRSYLTEREIKSYKSRVASGRASFDDAEAADSFGRWARGVLAPGSAKSDDAETMLKSGFFGDSREAVAKSMVTNVNVTGGALVPPQFIPFLIDLKDQRGVARRVMRTWPMSNSHVSLPKRTGGVTVYAPGEASSITASDAATANVGLTANKMGSLSYVSNELWNDSAINIGDFIAREIMYAFADAEDKMVFNGDGTSTFFGGLGFRAALKGLDSTIANIAGLTVASGNLFSEFTLTDFEDVAGNLPAAVANPRWYMHKRVYWNVCRRLALASGGTTGTEVINGIAQTQFLGYPVEFVQVMPSTDANSQVAVLFGDLDQAGKIGEVTSSMSIQTDASVGFASDVMAIRGVQRFGVSVHDVGNASATAASRVPGWVVGLISAAS